MYIYIYVYIYIYICMYTRHIPSLLIVPIIHLINVCIRKLAIHIECDKRQCLNVCNTISYHMILQYGILCCVIL